MKTILFQGDSITDAGRSRTDDAHLGVGYPLLVTGKLSCDRPGEFHFLNRGISGNRTIDLIARVKPDIIRLQPDYMSILIGVNDVWHEFYEVPNGIDAVRYETYYDMLLSEVTDALPSVRLMILEPFTLCGAGNEAYYDAFRAEVDLRAAAARRIAEKYHAVFVPLQSSFDRLAAETGDASLWLYDGVHPTTGGHEMIARAWLSAFEKLEKA